MMKDIIERLRDVRNLDVRQEMSVATANVVERACREGLVDVAWKCIDSPVGPLILAGTEAGLIMVAYQEEDVASILSRLAERVSPRVLHVPSRLDPVHRELDEYFAGRRRRFGLRIDWSLVRAGFQRVVLEATTQIRYGEQTTYGEIAGRTGRQKAWRAVGNALGGNPLCIVIPCHRVVRSNGSLGGYAGGLDQKRLLLDLEGKHFRHRS